MKKLILLLFCFLFPGLAWAKTFHTTSPKVTLKLSYDASVWQQVRFSNDKESWSDPEPLTSTRTGWDIRDYGGGLEYGVACVYAMFQANDDTWSESISACLIWVKPALIPVPEEPVPSVKGRGCLGGIF